jgi:hypothetical protein
MSDYRQRTLYSHQSSKDRRKPEKPDPVAVLSGTHSDEKSDLGSKHKSEDDALTLKFNKIWASDQYKNDHDAEEAKARKLLHERQATARDKMEKRHRAELGAAQKQHTIE